jgi:23S rRNA pseudouridine1911/1915/1917 synthase
MNSGTLQGREQIFKVMAEEKGMRLDVYLSGRNLSISRSQIKRMIEEGQVGVNGKKAKAGYKLRTGDAVSYIEREAISYDAVPEDIPLRILYEDKDLVVVDKLAGMVVHPAAGNYQGTLVNALLHHCRDFTGIGGVLRPGIVHRLDKDTSGLIVAAKNERTLNDLQNQFKGHRIKKVYRALVFGNLPEDEGVIDAPVGRHPTDRKKMSTVSKRGKEALTRWRVLERYGILTLVDVRIETGRTHQIRVHFTAIGHPIVGDKVYGNSVKRIQNISPNVVQSKLKMLKRQALHAACLGFQHPALEEYLEFSAPLPPDMAGLVYFMRDYIKDKYGQDFLLK